MKFSVFSAQSWTTIDSCRLNSTMTNSLTIDHILPFMPVQEIISQPKCKTLWPHFSSSNQELSQVAFNNECDKRTIVQMYNKIQYMVQYNVQYKVKYINM